MAVYNHNTQLKTCLKIMSFNMHGFFQGCPALDDMITQYSPDVFCLQEHWLTPTNLSKFDIHFTDYFSVGSSAMSSTVETGMLRGRPFGGVMCLIKNNLRAVSRTVYCSERYVIIKVNDCIVANVYLPCVGTVDRDEICGEILAEIGSWYDHYSDCTLVIAGDFNVDLDCKSSIANSICDFANRYSLLRCDKLFSNEFCPTYRNFSLNHHSRIDFILASCACTVSQFLVTDPDVNFSDHLPLFAVIDCRVISPNVKPASSSCNSQTQLRWDRADVHSYYNYTGSRLSPLLSKLDNILPQYKNGIIENSKIPGIIDSTYNEIIYILNACAKDFVPLRRKSFYKFWWNVELDSLKEASVQSNRLWVSAGRPRHGPIYDKRQSTRLQYRKRIREGQRMSDEVYTNELHEALMKKEGRAFWNSWRSKFESSNTCLEVDGSVDADIIADRFAQYFSLCYSCNDVKQKDILEREYSELRDNYHGLPPTTEILFNTELVSKIVATLKRGKAADIDGLTSEHLLFSHPILPVIISRLFELILHSQYIPCRFKHSYIVPIPKPRDTRTKAITYDDFRGIAITPVLCKVFEYCFLDKFQSIFITDDNQFGFKKGRGCRHAIYAFRSVVNHFVNSGDTVNVCALDLSKAFDKVNHCALYIKLMKRQIPVKLLSLLENLFFGCFSCVKWNNVWSAVFEIRFGVRQGSILSPFLFGIYLNDLGKLCSPRDSCFIILYADDILLISPSVTQTERLLHRCEQELAWLDMRINFKKSGCLRVGSRCDITCAAIASSDGCSLPWVSELRYLGVFITQSKTLKCSLDSAKRGFYRAANSIFGKVGRIASHDTVLHLVKSKCLPILLYGLEVLPLNKAQLRSLDFVVNRFFMKLFKTNNIQTVEFYRDQFNFELPSHQITVRYAKFLNTITPDIDMFTTCI